MQDFDDNKIENYLENHDCSDVEKKLTCDDSGLGSNIEPEKSEKVVEYMNMMDQNQKNQDHSVLSRNKRSSEASEESNEHPMKRYKYGNTGHGVSSRGIQN